MGRNSTYIEISVENIQLSYRGLYFLTNKHIITIQRRCSRVSEDGIWSKSFDYENIVSRILDGDTSKSYGNTNRGHSTTSELLMSGNKDYDDGIAS